MAEGHVQRSLKAIRVAHVAGYSQHMAADEETTLRTLKAHRQIIDGLITRQQGRPFGTAFTAPSNTIDCRVQHSYVNARSK